jgi:seryl-tRNA synthetase
MHSVDLNVSIPEELVKDFLGKLHYVSEEMTKFEFSSEKRDQIKFDLKSNESSKAKLISEQILEIAQKMCKSYRANSAKVLIDRPITNQSFTQDPHPILESAGDLFKYGSGRYGLGPKILSLCDYFDREFVKLSQKFSATPHQFPSLIGAEVLDRCKYLKSFPHALTFASHLHEDLEAIRGFASSVRWQEDHLSCKEGSMDAIQCLLSPTVCFHCYAWLQSQRLSEPKTITAIGKCFRYEAGSMNGLERLWDFNMREIIFVGPQEFVLKQRQKAIDETVALLDQWELSYQIKSATDPFFIEEFSNQTAFQLAFELKFEIRAALPYKEDSLAVGSFNYHQDFFGRTFDIQNNAGQASHTGCVGFGLERMALAFFAQHGMDEKNWPKSVVSGLEK